MSYFCYVHNWTSPNYSCPECHKTETYVSSSTELKLTADVKFESVLAAENEKLCDELSEMTTKLYYQRERLQQAELERDEAIANEQASATAYAEVKAELDKVTKELDAERLDFARLIKEVDDVASRCREAYDSAQSELEIARERVKELEGAVRAHLGHEYCECGCENCEGCASDSMIKLHLRCALSGAEPKSRG